MRDVEIRDLVVRVPGVRREQAGAIAAAVARRLLDTVPEWREADVPELATVRVQVQRGATAGDIVRQVAEAIAGMLR